MATFVAAPRPRRRLPGRTKSHVTSCTLAQHVDGALGRVVSHPHEGTLAALNMRAAAQRPCLVEESYATRKEALARSPTACGTHVALGTKLLLRNRQGDCACEVSNHSPPRYHQRHYQTAIKGSQRAPLTVGNPAKYSTSRCRP